MDLTLGVIHYSNLRASERPDIAVGALTALATASSHPATFQGQLAGSDRWTRRTKASPRSLAQLTTDLRGGVYSHIIGYRGARNAESAVLSFECGTDDRAAAYPISVTYVTRAGTKSEITQGVSMGVALWDLFSPPYGICVAGEDWNDVNAELTTIPYTLWGVTTDRADEERLLALQGLRPLFGSYTREAGWGNFLGAQLVKRLGGAEEVRRRAPVAKMQDLAGGGLYLQVSDAPLLVKTEGYRAALSELNDYFRPIRVPDLQLT